MMDDEQAPWKGRPYGVASDAKAVLPDAQRRAAWLLRINRLYGEVNSFTKSSHFATAFPGGWWKKSISTSQISRWENGLLRVPYEAYRRYEQLLGLPNNAIVSTVDGVFRYYMTQPQSLPLVARNVDVGDSKVRGRTNMLIDLAMSQDVMTGNHWDELTINLISFRDAFVPRVVWAGLTERLIAEQVIADGKAWIQRAEALSRLLAHREAQQSAISSCAELGRDQSNQSPIESISALDSSGHPDASNHIVSQLANPATNFALLGALLGSIRKVKFGHFTRPQIHQLSMITIELMTDPKHRNYAQPLAAEVLRLLPPYSYSRWGSKLSKVLADNRTLSAIFATGHSNPQETSSALIRRVANKAISRLPRYIPGYREEILPVLIDEILFSPVTDVRLLATWLVYASPYCDPVASSFIVELSKPHILRDPELARSMLRALRSLGGVAHRPVIEQLILAPGLSRVVTEAAAFALGHVAGSSTDAFYSSVMSRYLGSWKKYRDSTSELVLDSIAYVLGVARNEQMLHTMRENVEYPSIARESAAWWLKIQKHIYKSARH